MQALCSSKFLYTPTWVQQFILLICLFTNLFVFGIIFVNLAINLRICLFLKPLLLLAMQVWSLHEHKKSPIRYWPWRKLEKPGDLLVHMKRPIEWRAVSAADWWRSTADQNKRNAKEKQWAPVMLLQKRIHCRNNFYNVMLNVHYQHHLYCTVTTTKTVDREFNSEKVLKTNRQKPIKYYTGLQMYYGLYLQTYIVVTKFCQVKLLYLSHPQHFEWVCTHHLFLFI
jgi:hypothetical protein